MTKRPQEPRVAVRNASDAKQVQRAKESERARVERERNALAFVMSTPIGRFFVYWWLVEKPGVYRLSMASDPYWTAFYEGARNGGLEALAYITQATPDEYVLMMQEHAASEALEPNAPEPTTETEEADARSND